jgi:hypothetical protein
VSYTILNVIKDLVTGNLNLANKELANERTSICSQCDVRNKQLNICTLCGCYIKAKVKLTKSNCPMGLW